MSSSINFTVDSRDYSITKESDPLLFKYLSLYDKARQNDFYVTLHRDRGLKDSFKISPTLSLEGQLCQNIFAKESLSKQQYDFYIGNKKINPEDTALGMLLKSGVVITGKDVVIRPVGIALAKTVVNQPVGIALAKTVVNRPVGIGLGGAPREKYSAMETKIATLRTEIYDLVKKGDHMAALKPLETLGDLYKNDARYSMAAKYYAQAADYCVEKNQKLDMHQKSADAYSSAGSFYTASIQLEKVIDLFLINGEKERALDVFETIKIYLVPTTDINGFALDRIQNKLK